MPRPRRDGTSAHTAKRRQHNDLWVRACQGGERDELFWDTKAPGLALMVRASGRKSWKVIYRHHGRPRWLHLGDAQAIGLADARRQAAKVALAVMEGKDPATEKRVERMSGTFAELHGQYLELWPGSTTAGSNPTPWCASTSFHAGAGAGSAERAHCTCDCGGEGAGGRFGGDVIGIRKCKQHRIVEAVLLPRVLGCAEIFE
jgi:Arm DNA-binding domain